MNYLSRDVVTIWCQYAQYMYNYILYIEGTLVLTAFSFTISIYYKLLYTDGSNIIIIIDST